MHYRGVFGSERRVSSVLSDERSSLQSGTLPPPRSSNGYADLRKKQEREYAYRQEHQRDQRSAFDWNSSYGDGVYNNTSRDDSTHVEVIRLVNQERNNGSNTIPMRVPSMEKIRARMMEQNSHNTTNSYNDNNNNNNIINNKNLMKPHNSGVVGTRGAGGSSNSSRNQLRGGQILDDTFEEIYTEEERATQNTKAVDHYGGGKYDSRYNAGYEKDDYPEEEQENDDYEEDDDDYDDDEEDEDEEDVPRIPIIGGHVNGKVMRDILYGTPKAGDAYQTRQEAEIRKPYKMRDPPTSYQRDYSMPENDGNRDMWSRTGSEVEEEEEVGPPMRSGHIASAPHNHHHHNHNHNNHINKNNNNNNNNNNNDKRRLSESSPTHRTWQPRPEKPPASPHAVSPQTHSRAMEPFTAEAQERPRRNDKHTSALQYREERRINDTMESSHAPFSDTAEERNARLQSRRHTPPKRRSDRHAPPTYEEREESQKQQQQQPSKTNTKKRRQQLDEYEDNDTYKDERYVDAYAYEGERYGKSGRSHHAKEKRSPSPEEPSSSSYPAAVEKEEEKEESLETGASPKAEKRKKKIKRASSSHESGRKSRSMADAEEAEAKAKRKHKRKQKIQHEEEDEVEKDKKEENDEAEVGADPATFTATESCTPAKTKSQKEGEGEGEEVRKEKVFCGKCFGGSMKETKKEKEKKKKDAKHSDHQNAITQTQSLNEPAGPKENERQPSETSVKKKKELKTKQEEEEKKEKKKERKRKEVVEEEEEEYEEEYEEYVEEDIPVDPSLSSTFHSEVNEKVKETTRRNASLRRSANSERGASRRHRHLGNNRVENWSDVD